MINHTLEKTQWLVATPLIFGNHLKFGLDSCHNAKCRPTFLYQEREHLKLRANHTHTTIHISRGALQRGPAHTGVVATASGQMKAHDDGDNFSTPFRSRPGINTNQPIKPIWNQNQITHKFHTTFPILKKKKNPMLTSFSLLFLCVDQPLRR